MVRKDFIFALVLFQLFVYILIIPQIADAHQSGCHRWHSCPSDSGSYVCGDLGYDTYCPKSVEPKKDKSLQQSTPKSPPSSFQSSRIPEWIKNNARWWAAEQISDSEFLSGIRHLIEQKILIVSETSVSTKKSQEIPQWVKNNAKWWSEGVVSDDDFISGIKYLVENNIISVHGTSISSEFCQGTKLCLKEFVQRIIDGDTLIIGKYTVRLSLVNTPEESEEGFKEASLFAAKLCRVGSFAILDQDDRQPLDKYGRLIGKVFCSDKNLNEELLENGLAKLLPQYCLKSEFYQEDWAKKYGCS